MQNIERAIAVPAYQATPQRRFYYGWVCVAAAALAMAATLPGRTMGLGLVTESILDDLPITRQAYAQINLVATLVGAGFGLIAGRLLDRFGARIVIASICLALGLAVVMLSRTTSAWNLLIAATLTRGLGQSALSAASVSLVGKWFDRRAGPAMAAYAILLTIGFMIAMPSLEFASKQFGWRAAWTGLGVILASGVAPLLYLSVRDKPESIGLVIDGAPRTIAIADIGHSLQSALATPAFWALAFGGFVFNSAYSGITLFNESLLAKQGLRDVAMPCLVVMAFTGLASNFLAGALSRRFRPTRLMSLAMAVLAGAMFSLPYLRTTPQAIVYAAVMGVSGGVVTVVFFVSWGRLFGRRNLGKIQGAAQGITVLASAAGPWILAFSLERTATYAAGLTACAAAAGILAVVGWLTPLPAEHPFDTSNPLRS